MKKKIFFGVNTIIITSILSKKFFKIKKVETSNFDPLIKKNTYVLIINKNRKKPTKTGLIYFFDEKTNKNKISYKISSGPLVRKKNSKSSLLIRKNHSAHCCYDEDVGKSVNVVNNSFILGYPVFDFGRFRFLREADLDFERIFYEVSDLGINKW